MNEDEWVLEIVEADEPDLYAEGYDHALAEATRLVRRRYHAVRGGGELRAPDMELLLAELAELGQP